MPSSSTMDLAASVPTALIVDDEQLIRWSLKQRFTEAGYQALEAATGGEALERLTDAIDLVLLDFKLPDTTGSALLKVIKQTAPDTPVIFMTAFSSIESGIESMKNGAYHYFSKPFDMNEMMLLAAKAFETTRLRREVKSLRAAQSPAYAFERIIGESAAMQSVKAILRRVAESKASTVLLTGESGTGKDLCAKAIHFNSNRAWKPFMTITCSALPEQLLESELFGHERGAFTDAKQLKRGLLEQADGGTVFLDEIGEMAPGLQAKLLRFLEDKTFKRVGGVTDITIDVRVIAATNRNLEQAVQIGTFREDLYYRLHVMPIVLPPLRERAEDIPRLANYYVDSFNRELKKAVQSISAEAVALLAVHRWPGNVRELKNAIERAMLLTDQSTLSPDDFLPIVRGVSLATGYRLPANGIDFEELERDLVEQALDRTSGNLTRAAALLGMNRDQIRYRIEKYELARLRAPSSSRHPPESDH